MSKICFLIDDDEDDREIFALALENIDTDYKCTTAKNGLEALKILEEGLIPDFIFIDLNMPYMSGREFLEQLKQMPSLADVPAIVYTTSSHDKDREETKALGAAHYLVKPTSLTTLTNLLKDILGPKDLPFYLNSGV